MISETDLERLKNIWWHVLEDMPQESMFALAQTLKMHAPGGFQLKSLAEPLHERRLRLCLWQWIGSGRRLPHMTLGTDEAKMRREDGSYDVEKIEAHLLKTREEGDKPGLANTLAHLLLSADKDVFALALKYGDDSEISKESQRLTVGKKSAKSAKSAKAATQAREDSTEVARLQKRLNRAEKEIKRLEEELSREREAKETMLAQKKKATQAKNELAMALETTEQAAAQAAEEAAAIRAGADARVRRALLAGKVFWLPGEAPAVLAPFVNSDNALNLADDLLDAERTKNRLMARRAEVVYADPTVIPSGDLMVLRRILKTKNLPIALVTEPVAATAARMEELMK